MVLKRTWAGLLSLALIVSLAGCAPTGVAQAEALPTDPAPPTGVVEPSPTSEPTTAPEPTAPPAPAPETATIQLFLVALEDGGATGQLIGCDDSLVPVQHQVAATDDPIAAALEALLALGGPTHGGSGLYNALYQSNLHVDSLALEGDTATVYLAGDLALGGVCDNPRVEAQIVETVRQFAGVERVSVFINNTPLADLLSGKG